MTIMTNEDVVIFYDPSATSAERETAEMANMLRQKGYKVVISDNFSSVMWTFALGAPRAVIAYHLNLKGSGLIDALDKQPYGASLFMAHLYESELLPALHPHAADVEYRVPLGPKKIELVNQIDAHLKNTPKRMSPSARMQEADEQFRLLIEEAQNGSGL